MEDNEPNRPSLARFLILGILMIAIYTIVMDRPLPIDPVELSAQAQQIPTINGAGLRTITQDTTPDLLFIYATWCPHCRRQKPIIEQLQSEYQGRFNIAAISIDKNPNDLAAYLQSNPTSLNVARVAEVDFLDFRLALAETGSQFTGAIPYTAFVGSDGKILAEIPGYIDKATFDSLIQQMGL